MFRRFYSPLADLDLAHGTLVAVRNGWTIPLLVASLLGGIGEVALRVERIGNAGVAEGVNAREDAGLFEGVEADWTLQACSLPGK